MIKNGRSLVSIFLENTIFELYSTHLRIFKFGLAIVSVLLSIVSVGFHHGFKFALFRSGELRKNYPIAKIHDCTLYKKEMNHTI